MALKGLIGYLEETGNDLVKLSGPGTGSSSVEEQVRVCVERYELLQKQTEERGIKIGMTLAQEEDLQNRLDELLTLLERRKEDFANLKPISVQPDTIREQLEELQVRYWIRDLFTGITGASVLQIQWKLNHLLYQATNVCRRSFPDFCILFF